RRRRHPDPGVPPRSSPGRRPPTPLTPNPQPSPEPPRRVWSGSVAASDGSRPISARGPGRSCPHPSRPARADPADPADPAEIGPDRALGATDLDQTRPGVGVGSDQDGQGVLDGAGEGCGPLGGEGAVDGAVVG